MAKTREIVVTVIAAIAAAVGLAWLIVKRNGPGDVLDEIGDTIVDLTTSEESRLQQLEPGTQTLIRQLIQQLANNGLDVYVGQTLRTQAQEKQAIDAGKSGVKSHSWHEIGRAVDLYPVDPDTGRADQDGKRDDLFTQMQQSAVAMGLRQIAYDVDTWQRRYITNAQGKKIWDGGHIEYHGSYATIAEAVAAEGSNYGIT